MDLYKGMDQLRDLTKLYMDMKNPQVQEETAAPEQVDEKAKNPYAIGMASAMDQTGDTPPLEKSTIKKAHKIADAIKKEEVDVEEGIDFKGARREQARRDAIQAAKDKKSPSSRDRRLMRGKFRPGASADERAEGGRDAMREKGTSPTRNGKPLFQNFEIMADYLIAEGQVQTVEEASEFLAGAPQEFLQGVLRFAEQRMLFMSYLVETGHCADLTEAASVYEESDPELVKDVIDTILAD